MFKNIYLTLLLTSIWYLKCFYVMSMILFFWFWQLRYLNIEYNFFILANKWTWNKVVTLQQQQGHTARLIADHSTEFVVGLVRSYRAVYRSASHHNGATAMITSIVCALNVRSVFLNTVDQYIIWKLFTMQYFTGILYTYTHNTCTLTNSP